MVDDNKVKPDYSRIRVPVLAIYRTMTLAQMMDDYAAQSEQ